EMSGEAGRSKISCDLGADVAGYSRLMGAPTKRDARHAQCDPREIDRPEHRRTSVALPTTSTLPFLAAPPPSCSGLKREETPPTRGTRPAFPLSRGLRGLKRFGSNFERAVIASSRPGKCRLAQQLSQLAGRQPPSQRVKFKARRCACDLLEQTGNHRII